MIEERPNALLQGGEFDGQTIHLGRGQEPRTYTAPNGQVYESTREWEGALLIYQCPSSATLPRGDG